MSWAIIKVTNCMEIGGSNALYPTSDKPDCFYINKENISTMSEKRVEVKQDKNTFHLFQIFMNNGDSFVITIYLNKASDYSEYEDTVRTIKRQLIS